MYEDFSLIRRLSQVGTKLHTKLQGLEEGADSFGNRYYRSRSRDDRRWVIYAGEPEPTKIPPAWHIWLHHVSNMPLSGNGVRHELYQISPYDESTTLEQHQHYQAWRPDE